MYPTGTKFKTADGTEWEIYFADEISKEYKCKSTNKKNGILRLKNFKEEDLEGVEFI
jgi:hypothetical protein